MKKKSCDIIFELWVTGNINSLPSHYDENCWLMTLNLYFFMLRTLVLMRGGNGSNFFVCSASPPSSRLLLSSPTNLRVKTRFSQE